MNYKIIKTNRKTTAITINSNSEITIRCPKKTTDIEAERFVQKNRLWIEKNIQKMDARRQATEILTSEDIALLKKFAAEIVPQKVDFFCKKVGLSPKSVKITSAKKRFGSCSGTNAICFSLYLMRYPEAAIDYCVVHELCHIYHHNHSKNFYKMVAKFLPDYKEREQLLKSAPLKMDDVKKQFSCLLNEPVL